LAFAGYDPEAPKGFPQFAQLCIDSAKKNMNMDLGYDLESIKKLDDVISIIGKPKNLGQMVTVIGSFLGEAFRRIYDGRWEWSEQFKTWAVMFRLPDGKEEGAFVFAKVQKRFVNGTQDSVAFYAHVTDSKVKGRIP